MTYSVVAHCSRTGRLGVGVQSHYLAAASIVSWVRASAGAVATQSEGIRMYGARGLELMSTGIAPPDALSQLTASDDAADTRQVAFVDASGRTAVHTGNRCIAEAGHVVGDGVVFQANMMRNPGVPEAMAKNWELTADLDLEYRIIYALEAAQAFGGDIRGMQAAGLHIAEPVEADVWWEGASIDLRVDDHPQPLVELQRLLNLRHANVADERATQAAADGDWTRAEECFARAHMLAPDSKERWFWHGVALANAGKVDEAKVALAIPFTEHDGWVELFRRLPAAGYLDIKESTFNELLNH